MKTAVLAHPRLAAVAACYLLSFVVGVVSYVNRSRTHEEPP